jgi:DNA-directed RNA polymerase subunit RPC12/RpoP
MSGFIEEEKPIFNYESSPASELWVDGDGPIQEFEFTLTNRRIIVTSDETGEVSVPLPILGRIGSKTETSMTAEGRTYLKWLSLSVIGGILLYALYTALTNSIIWAVVYAVILFVIWVKVGGSIENMFSWDWRWLSFQVNENAELGNAVMGYADPDPESSDSDILIRMRDNDFSTSEMQNLTGLKLSALRSEKEPFAIPNAVLEHCGMNIKTPETIKLKPDRTRNYDGGPKAGGYYVCEGCGEKLDAAFDIQGSNPAKCGNCGYELDDQQGAITEEMEAESAWAEAMGEDDPWDV